VEQVQVQARVLQQAQAGSLVRRVRGLLLRRP